MKTLTLLLLIPGAAAFAPSTPNRETFTALFVNRANVPYLNNFVDVDGDLNVAAGYRPLGDRYIPPKVATFNNRFQQKIVPQSEKWESPVVAAPEEEAEVEVTVAVTAAGETATAESSVAQEEAPLELQSSSNEEETIETPEVSAEDASSKIVSEEAEAAKEAEEDSLGSVDTPPLHTIVAGGEDGIAASEFKVSPEAIMQDVEEIERMQQAKEEEVQTEEESVAEEEEKVELVEAMAGVAQEEAIVPPTDEETPAAQEEPLFTVVPKEEVAAPEPVLTEAEVRAAIQADQEEAIQQVTQRVQRLCPNMHPDLFRVILQIQSPDTGVAVEGLYRMAEILDKEEQGDETTLALYHSCGHIFIMNTMMKHAANQELQQVAMNVVWKLSSRHRAGVISFKEIGTFQRSLVSVGAADCAFAAIQSYREDISLATYSLCVVNNLIDTYSFDELFELGVIAETMASMERFPEDTSVQFVACDILYRATKDKPDVNLAKLEEVRAVTVLAQVMEKFSGVDDRLHEKAHEALRSMLMAKV